VQTIRDEKGDNIIIKFLDREGPKRLILPPKVAATIARQKDALTTRGRSNRQPCIHERTDGAAANLPGFMRAKKGPELQP